MSGNLFDELSKSLASGAPRRRFLKILVGRVPTPQKNAVGDVDAWLDTLIEAQRRAPDADRRRDLVRQAVRLINEQAYSLAIYSGDQFQLWQPSLRCYTPNFASLRAPHADSWLAL